MFYFIVDFCLETGLFMNNIQYIEQSAVHKKTTKNQFNGWKLGLECLLRVLIISA